jgi:sugar lactone lactonase YvrE
MGKDSALPGPGWKYRQHYGGVATAANPAQQSSGIQGGTMQTTTLLSGIAMGESPRWHDNRLWFADWGAQQIVAAGIDGSSELILTTEFGLPFSIDWLHDGTLLIVAGRQGQLMRRDAKGVLVVHAELGSIGMGAWNEIVVDGRGNIYVNGGPGCIVLIGRDGGVRKVADGIAFANGMAVTADNSTLIIAESHGNCLTAFDIGADGTLSNRRIWADLGAGAPDGICLDAEGAVWYADVPNRCCVRVREGGAVLQSVTVDRGCFACTLGGDQRRTLFVMANEWRGMDRIPEVAQARTGVVLMVEAPVPGVGWP